MKNMYTLNKNCPQIIRLLVLLPLLLQLSTAFAKHIIGGEIIYECQGISPWDASRNRYFVTMKIYRDCDPSAGGAFFDDPAVIGIYRGQYNGPNTLDSSFYVFGPSITEIVPDTPKCIQNVPYTCVEEGIYSFILDLPRSTTESYFIVYQRCCRNNSIVNIIEPEDVGATYYTEITPAAQTACNNSPVYEEFPPIIICKGVPLEFDHSAIDPDGDQLVYSFCAPHNGGGKGLTGDPCDAIVPNPPCSPPFESVPFVQPQYSPGNPMGGDPQITINPVTGLIQGTPDMIGRFVVGVCVDEYRNGVKLSTIKRDFQFNVTDCDPTVLAKIDGGDTLYFSQGAYYLETCGPKELYIENKSVDINAIKEFEWRFSLLGTPYFNNSDWSPTIDFPENGRYYGLLILNPNGGVCTDTARIVVDVFPVVNADFEFAYDTCVAGPVTFNDLSTGEGGLEKWAWQFGVSNGASTDTNPVFKYEAAGEYPVKLRVVDKNGCEDVASKNIRYFPAPPYIIVQPDRFAGCVPATIQFVNLSAPLDETYKVVWDFGDGSPGSTEISPTHIFDKAGVYDIRVEITSPIGCFISDSFPNFIKTYDPPIADFSFAPTEVDILNPTVSFTDLSTDAKYWNWKFDRFGTSVKQNPEFVFPDTGLMRIRLIVTHPEGCKDSLVQFLDVKPVVTWFMPNAFTPNGDGTNDGFLGKGLVRGATDFNMSIWNRWGEMVFQTSNPDEPWNGRAQQTGGLSPVGVYVYTVSFTGPRGEKFEYKGYATLVR
jgi:gliding motility-associated-like protein